MATIDSDVLGALEQIAGAHALKCGNLAARYDPGIDASNLGADVLVRPDSTGQVSAIAALCSKAGIALVPHGGRTGLSGGATSRSGQLVVDMTAMNRIVAIDPVGQIATVEAGVRLQVLQVQCAEHQLSPGIDLGARGSATIGGMISTNAGGIEAFRNGTMAHRLLGIEAVLASGAIIDELKLVPKANEGYRMSQLFAGAEGTLGIVTQSVLRLEPARTSRTTALVAAHSAAGLHALFRSLARDTGIHLLAAEIMWPDYARTSAKDLQLERILAFAPRDGTLFAIFEIADDNASGDVFQSILGEAVEAGEITDAIIAKSEAERQDIWRIREDSWSIERQLPHGFWFDVSVPQSELDRYVANLTGRIQAVAPQYRVFAMGHLGDGNLHLTIASGTHRPELKAPVSDAVYSGLAAMGGSFSAEHGIGTEKRETLARYTPAARLEAMQVIKTAFDPDNLMNPRKVL